MELKHAKSKTHSNWKKRKRTNYSDKDIEDDICDSKSDDVCPICLCACENAALLDKCFHKFCFLCILQWIKVGSEPRCPLCKQEFASLLYHIKSDLEYLRYFVKEKKTASIQGGMYRANFENQYNSKFGKKSKDEIQRAPNSAMHSLRKSVYMRGLNAKPANATLSPAAKVPFIKKFSLHAFQSNGPYWNSKLRPWIKRELQALLEEEDVELLVEFVMSLLGQLEITSKEFLDQLKDILFEHSDTFVNELLCFANAPYEMNTYDRLVVYDYSNARPSKYTTKKKH